MSDCSSSFQCGGNELTESLGLSSFCYPSYQLNRTGPGVLLASYASDDSAVRFVAMTEEQHVQYVLDAIVEIHGPIAKEQYTGR